MGILNQDCAVTEERLRDLGFKYKPFSYYGEGKNENERIWKIAKIHTLKKAINIYLHNRITTAYIYIEYFDCSDGFIPCSLLKESMNTGISINDGMCGWITGAIYPCIGKRDDDVIFKSLRIYDINDIIVYIKNVESHDVIKDLNLISN